MNLIFKNKTASPVPVLEDERWGRVVARDRSADGEFWYSVATTGIYCRPSCPSRTANPKNVQLHDTLADAKATGHRPCMRCNPDGQSIEDENAILVAKLNRVKKNLPSTIWQMQSDAALVISISCSRPQQV